MRDYERYQPQEPEQLKTSVESLIIHWSPDGYIVIIIHLKIIQLIPVINQNYGPESIKKCLNIS